MRCQLVYSVVIFSHRFLDSDCISFKTFAFLAVYWPFWTSLYSTDIKVLKKIFNRSSTMLNNVFNVFLSHFVIILHVNSNRKINFPLAFYHALTKGSKWQITQIWESDVCRLDLACSTSTLSLEQKHASCWKILLKSRHNYCIDVSVHVW